MRVLLLSDPGSVHTIRWARALAARGVNVLVYGLSNYDKSYYKDYPNIEVRTFGFPDGLFLKKNGSLSKSIYIKALPSLKRAIAEFDPDILHAHYASSYGFLGALSRFKPYLISIWGSDVYEFPLKSFIHKMILIGSLKSAHKVFSTSSKMKEHTRKYYKKEIEEISFGIDTKVFRPVKVKTIFNEDDIVIGTVKKLEEKYGIEYLIRAFRIITERYPYLPLKLLIVGQGPQKYYLDKLSDELNIRDKVIFTGYVSHDEIVLYHNMINIPVFLSTKHSESFGVSVLEASACEKAVVVADIGGLPEVVEDGITGLVVPPNNPEAASDAIEKLINDPALRSKLGKCGRERVIQKYNWNDNVEHMINYYSSLIDVAVR